jgi:hypothetical protein
MRKFLAAINATIEVDDPGIYNGNDRSLQSSRTTLLHVNQARPSSIECKLWRKANLLWSQHPDGTLHIPLGEWLLNPINQRQRHFAYIQKHRMSQRLYLQVDQEAYTLCQPTQNLYEFQLTAVTLPYNA